MVSLDQVKSSNSLISPLLPSLVAVFVGATSGIGEATIKQFAKHARQARAYLVGRSQDAGDRIVAECKELDSEGEYTFIKADVSLIRVVDRVCEEIKAKEDAINILFLSAGVPSMDGEETTEHLHLLAALGYYSRMRFTTNFLPLLHRGSVLRRVVFVAGGGLEGPLDTSDLPGRRVPMTRIRAHLCTLISLGLESIARVNPEVSFVHNYPGTVDTPLSSRVRGVVGVLLRAYIFLLGRWICVPIEECGERHLYLATSAKFAPATADNDNGSGVPLANGAKVARGITGELSSGLYSVGWDGTSASPTVEKLLAGYRAQGMVDKIWQHTESEFKRIAEQNDSTAR